MEELIELFKQSNENSLEHKVAKTRKLDDDLSKGLEMRQKSLETYGETMHRNGETPSKKSRKTGSDTMQYLHRKLEKDEALKTEELDLRREEISNRREEMLMIQTQQQQQQQQQQHNNNSSKHRCSWTSKWKWWNNKEN